MIEREEIPGSPEVLVTFRLVGATWADRVNLVGDFNDWDTRSLPMQRDPDGLSWSLAVRLLAGKTVQFRYLIDGKTWQNDWYADDFVPNAFGSENSVLIL